MAQLVPNHGSVNGGFFDPERPPSVASSRAPSVLGSTFSRFGSVARSLRSLTSNGGGGGGRALLAISDNLLVTAIREYNDLAVHREVLAEAEAFESDPNHDEADQFVTRLLTVDDLEGVEVDELWEEALLRIAQIMRDGAAEVTFEILDEATESIFDNPVTGKKECDARVMMLLLEDRVRPYKGALI